MMVEPSCRATPSGNGNVKARSHTTSPAMNVTATMRLATTMRRARRDMAITVGMVVRSSRTTTASAVCRVSSDRALPMAMRHARPLRPERR